MHLKKSTSLHIKDVVYQFYFNKVLKILILIIEKNIIYFQNVKVDIWPFVIFYEKEKKLSPLSCLWP